MKQQHIVFEPPGCSSAVSPKPSNFEWRTGARKRLLPSTHLARHSWMTATTPRRLRRRNRQHTNMVKQFLAMSKYIHFRHSSGVRWTVCSACSPQGCDDTCSHQIVGHVTPSVESCCSIAACVASIIIIYRSASHILVAHLVNSIQFNFSTANAANAFLRWKEPSPGVRGQRLLRFFARVR